MANPMQLMTAMTMTACMTRRTMKANCLAYPAGRGLPRPAVDYIRVT
jgi:hypothetical protein